MQLPKFIVTVTPAEEHLEEMAVLEERLTAHGLTRLQLQNFAQLRGVYRYDDGIIDEARDVEILVQQLMDWVGIDGRVTAHKMENTLPKKAVDDIEQT